jgi:hypothetical protein
VTRLKWAAIFATLAIAACGSAAAPTASAALTVDAAPDPTLALSDTATLTAGDTAVEITATLTCVTGYTAFGSVAVTQGVAPSQPQGYSGLLRIPCQGQPQELPLTLTSKLVPFHEGPALGRAAFTLNLCDPACRWVSVTKNVTVMLAAD